MPVTTKEYKSQLINTGDALPYPIATTVFRQLAGGTLNIDLTAASFAGATLMEIKQCNQPASTTANSNVVFFTMDATLPAIPGGVAQITTGTSANQCVLANVPCMRTIDSDTTEINIITRDLALISVTFW
jgi:hypothetical protein